MFAFCRASSPRHWAGGDRACFCSRCARRTDTAHDRSAGREQWAGGADRGCREVRPVLRGGPGMEVEAEESHVSRSNGRMVANGRTGPTLMGSSAGDRSREGERAGAEGGLAYGDGGEDQARPAEAKANDAGSGPYFCVAAAASETCVALARCGCTDLRLGRAFYRRRCGTRASEMRGVKFDQCGKAKQTLHQCRPDASSA